MDGSLGTPFEACFFLSGPEVAQPAIFVSLWADFCLDLNRGEAACAESWEFTGLAILTRFDCWRLALTIFELAGRRAWVL